MSFDWLPLSDRKGLPTPRVLYMDLDWCLGCFVARTPERCVEDYFGIDRSERDVIVFSTHWGELAGSVVAHEHRHFQQRYLLGLPRLGTPINQVRDVRDAAHWRAAIKRFYTSQPWEMDALRYSVRVHLDEPTEQQLEAVLC